MPVFGGVEVSWTYPGLNPEAVAHTLLYRRTSPVFADAPVRHVVTGNVHLDLVPEGTASSYYYWIRMISVHGTVGDLIGPVSVSIGKLVDQMTDILTGMVTSGTLDEDLREKLDHIFTLDGLLTGEMASRIDGDGVLGTLLTSLTSDLEAVDALVANEIITRTTENSAMVAELNLILAVAEDAAALVLTESLVRADADGALASQITTVETTANGAAAAVVTEATARATADGTLASSITTVSAAASGAQGTANSALTVANNTATGLSAKYLLKLDINGYVAGMGVYNDGVTSNILFHTANFAIGHPTRTTDYPFVIADVGGVSKIALNAATFIPDLSVTTAKIANASITNAKIGSLAVDTLQIAGSAIFVSVYSAGGSGLTYFNSTHAQIHSYTFTISGLPSGATAGVINLATFSIYPNDAVSSTIDVATYINGSNAGSTGATIGPTAITMSCIGYGNYGNGTHTVSLRVATTSTKEMIVNVSSAVMAGKR